MGIALPSISGQWIEISYIRGIYTMVSGKLHTAGVFFFFPPLEVAVSGSLITEVFFILIILTPSDCFFPSCKHACIFW